MFVGHLSIAFAAKTGTRSVPLWIYFLAVQWLDLAASILSIFGIETMEFELGTTRLNTLHPNNMIYTHSLPGAIAFSALFGSIVASRANERRVITFAVVSAAVFSHWLLDLIVHSGVPLYGGATLGLGLWRYAVISFLLELLLLVAAASLYSRAIPTVGARGTHSLWRFVALLVVLQVYVSFGPPPPSEMLMIIMVFVSVVVLTLFAARVEHARLQH